MVGAFYQTTACSRFVRFVHGTAWTISSSGSMAEDVDHLFSMNDKAM